MTEAIRPVSDHRVRMVVAYRGTHFHGWAAQPGLRTVQGVIEKALATIVRDKVSVSVAGRTDAGVHARRQVAHVDIPDAVWSRLRVAPKNYEPLRARIDGLVAREARSTSHPRDVVICQVEPVSHDFDARFSALTRHYCYRIGEQVGQWDPLRADVTWWPRLLDVHAMHRAAQALIGEHDFLPFAKPREGATTIRTLTQLDVVRTDEGIVECRVSADAFCHSQVRFMVGTLMRIGEGKQPVEWTRQLLKAGVRDSRVPLAPAEGLTLEQVDYPPASDYAAQAQRARRVRQLPASSSLVG